MDDVYKNIEEYKILNPNKKWKLLVVFDDKIADMLRNQNLNPMVSELLIRGRKLNIDHAFITQSYFAVAKIVSLNSPDYFVIKILNKKRDSANYIYNSWYIDFQDFIYLFKNILQNHILSWLLMLLLHQKVLIKL